MQGSGKPGGPDRWGIILAGGEGTRLRSLTRTITGDDRPKQFCPILDRETLLDRTRRRVALTVPPDRTLVVVTQTHERFYAAQLGDAPPPCVIVQPENKGTAPAILYALLCLASQRPMDAVAVLPSDHYVSDDAVFMAHVEAAFEAVHARPDLVVLLGITPDSPEVEYGWIEPGEPIPDPCGRGLARVRRLWEKPALGVAQALMDGRCLWNSFVMVARVPAFLALIRSARADLYDAFVGVQPRLGLPAEAEIIRPLYARLAPMNFSREVLATRPANLAVLPVAGIAWSDWGQPDHVLATLARMGTRPGWAESGAAVPA